MRSPGAYLHHVNLSVRVRRRLARAVRAAAVSRGIFLHQFVREALEEKLAAVQSVARRP